MRIERIKATWCHKHKNKFDSISNPNLAKIEYISSNYGNFGKFQLKFQTFKKWLKYPKRKINHFSPPPITLITDFPKEGRGEEFGEFPPFKCKCKHPTGLMETLRVNIVDLFQIVSFQRRDNKSAACLLPMIVYLFQTSPVWDSFQDSGTSL